MARLRIAPVEFKVCPCGKEYEGDCCPACQEPFDPSRTMKTDKPCLIVVGIEGEPYTRQARLKCSNKNCHNLYDIGDLRAFKELRDLTMLRDDPDRLAIKAHEKDQTVPRFLADLNAERKALKARVWSKLCPLCGSEPSSRESHVWVRTFAQRAPAVVLQTLVIRASADNEDDGNPEEEGQ